MIDWNKPLRMKNGTKIHRVLTHGLLNYKYPVLVTFIDIDTGAEKCAEYTIDGKSEYLGGNSRDLENIPKTIWHAIIMTYHYDEYNHSMLLTAPTEIDMKDMLSAMQKNLESYVTYKVISIKEQEV